MQKVVDSTGVVIEYVYDPVGNILQINRRTIAPGGPTIFNATPQTIAAGATLTIQGQGFVDSSVTAVTRPDRQTTEPVPRVMTYVSPSEMRVVLDEEDVAEVGTVQLTVVNPPPGGGASNTVVVNVHEPAAPSEKPAIPGGTV